MTLADAHTDTHTAYARTDVDALVGLRVGAEGVTRVRGAAKRVQWFKRVDPLSSNFPAYTPYHYTHGDPVNLVDPTGMSAMGANHVAAWIHKPQQEECCDFGGAAEEVSRLPGKYWESAKTLAKAAGSKLAQGFRSVMPEGGTPSSEDYAQTDATQGGGIEVLSTDDLPAANTAHTPDATDGSTAVVEMGAGDVPGGGGAKGKQLTGDVPRRLDQAATGVRKAERATSRSANGAQSVDTSREFHTVRHIGRTSRHGDIDTVYHD